LMEGLTESGAKSKTRGALSGAKEALGIGGDDEDDDDGKQRARTKRSRSRREE
jgi:gas vesicle structural protein